LNLLTVENDPAKCCVGNTSDILDIERDFPKAAQKSDISPFLVYQIFSCQVTTLLIVRIYMGYVGENIGSSRDNKREIPKAFYSRNVLWI